MDHLLNSVVEQVRMAFARKNRLATFLGFILGMFVPFATYFVAHQDTAVNRLYWVLVAGGLLFSAKTVYEWTKIAFQSGAKAFGFCLIIEGVMTFSPNVYLGCAALALLAGINGIATGCILALNQRQYQKTQRAAARKTQPTVGIRQNASVAARKQAVMN